MSKANWRMRIKTTIRFHTLQQKRLKIRCVRIRDMLFTIFTRHWNWEIFFPNAEWTARGINSNLLVAVSNETDCGNVALWKLRKLWLLFITEYFYWLFLNAHSPRPQEKKWKLRSSVSSIRSMVKDQNHISWYLNSYLKSITEYCAYRKKHIACGNLLVTNDINAH